MTRQPGDPPPEKRINVSMDQEAQRLLVEWQDILLRKLGFKPTLAQTVRWLARHAA